MTKNSGKIAAIFKTLENILAAEEVKLAMDQQDE
jgi:hypothetical protein